MFFRKKKKPSKELVDAAKELRKLLRHYAQTENEAETCLNALGPLIEGVLNEKIKLPVKDVPCGWYFIETKLAEYADLCAAYSSFSFQIQGFDRQRLDRFMKEVDEGKYYDD